MNCIRCEVSWTDPNKKYSNLTNCPFCQALLPNTNTNEGILLLILEKHKFTIYNEVEQFSKVVKEHFKHEDRLSRLLQISITHGASIEIFKLRSRSSEEFNANYNHVLNLINDRTFIAEEILAPAMNLLWFGVGEFTKYMDKAPVEEVEQPVEEPTQQPTQAPQPVRHENLDDDFNNLMRTMRKKNNAPSDDVNLAISWTD